MNPEDNIEPLGSFSLKKGILLGIGASILVFVVYIVDYTLLVHWSLSIMTLILLLAVVVIFGIGYRKHIGGYLSFGKAYKLSLIILLVATLVQMGFNNVLYNLVDPELPELLTKATINNTEQFLRSMGMNQDQIDEQLKALETEVPKQFAITTQLKNLWVIVISAAFFALIAGAIIKKNEPIVKS